VVEGKVRAVVADDHPLYLAGLRQAIRNHPRLELTGDATNGEEAIRLIREVRPEVALLDMRMPAPHGLGVLRTIRDEGLDTRVVLISAYADEQIIYDALAAGAHGYLSKEADDEEICNALLGAAFGVTTVSRQLQGLVWGRIRLQAGASSGLLSRRERQVLTLVARGRPGRQIASDLHVSPSTVKTYMSRIFAKLDVPDRASATAEAVRRGWVH
jgi:two-component system, NarL family, nitrate/nitrite response regulator NarL